MKDKKIENTKEILSETEQDIVKKSQYIEPKVRKNNNFHSFSKMLSKKFESPLQAPKVDDTKKQEKIDNISQDSSRKNNRSITNSSADKIARIVKVKEFLGSRKLWLGLASIGIGSIIIYGGVTWRKLEQSLPDIADISSYSRDGTLTIKAADGKIIQQTGPATREKIKLEDIPTPLVQAFIAIEDRRFYQHRGVDYRGIIRALISNLMARDVVQGGSSITQQLARMVFLDMEQTIWRKLREAMLAWKMERELSKEEILELYLNIVYLGSGAYGVTDAAWVYFSKPVSGLSLAEMATLAGLPPAPSEYSPLVSPEAAKNRRNIVLGVMQEAGLISQQRAEIAIAKPMEVQPSAPKRLIVEAPYFANYIQKELPKYVSQEVIDAGGLTIETTLDRNWQEIGEQVIQDAVDIDGANQRFDQAALVAIDATTGEVKALVGGRNFAESEFNRAIQAQRQPGSTFKSFVYAAAVAAGFPPTDGYRDVPFTVDGYKPKNYGKKYAGWRSMIDSLAYSVNVVAVQVLMDVGFEPVIELAEDMGIKSEVKATYSMALGTWEVNLLELTNAYATLAAEGKFIGAHGIKRIINQNGQVVYEAYAQPKQVLDSDSARIVTWMLENVVKYGSGSNAYLYDRPVAGKTGTTEEARDLWFIGYIPQVATGIWLGNDDNKPTWGVSSTAAFNWRQFMKQIVKDIPVQDFPDRPSFYDREPTIEAKPVEPEWIRYGKIGPDGRDVNERKDDRNY
ncbi:transglycosylase domain-containing protein [Okeania sp. SIO3B5]|uniref:transglycosylase domain-containing protein n=1 Tax=Okeania sp. SIO3B5 TaxID=2607811 RepID=UPI00260028E7|nr:PBP1A family penicillin-binding protein [Okeania sp. SIO3B5]